MLTVGFKKLSPMNLASHLDMMRAVMRTIARADIDVEMSKGFNPHKEIYVTPPLPLGVNSVSEYMTVYTSVDAESFLKKYNACAVKGLEAFSAKRVEKNPNLAGIVTSADYEIRIDNAEAFKVAVNDMLNASEYLLTAKNKDGQETVKDVRSKILSASVDGNILYLHLRAGNDNLRADKLFEKLCTITGEQYFVGRITRTMLYTERDGKEVKFSELF